jgi:hypothetical protein
MVLSLKSTEMIGKIENISKQIENQIQIKELEVFNIIRDVPPNNSDIRKRIRRYEVFSFK